MIKMKRTNEQRDRRILRAKIHNYFKEFPELCQREKRHTDWLSAETPEKTAPKINLEYIKSKLSVEEFELLSEDPVFFLPKRNNIKFARISWDTLLKQPKAKPKPLKRLERFSYNFSTPKIEVKKQKPKPLKRVLSSVLARRFEESEQLRQKLELKHKKHEINKIQEDAKLRNKYLVKRMEKVELFRKQKPINERDEKIKQLKLMWKNYREENAERNKQLYLNNKKLFISLK